MQYGAIPSVNSIRALYNFRDKPWIVWFDFLTLKSKTFWIQFAELLKIQRRLGIEQFPLINQTYYPNHRKMVNIKKYNLYIKFFFCFSLFLHNFHQ